MSPNGSRQRSPWGPVAAVCLLAAGLTGPFFVRPAAAQDHAHHGSHRPPPSGERRETGLTIPDMPVTTQDGESVSFYGDLIEDRLVAINFIFTTCTTICPPMGATFAKLQERLGTAAGRDVHLVSVSVDPVVDTPQRLKQWGARFGAGPGWTLVTGDKADVDRLLKSLQVFTPDYEDHSPTVLVGNDSTGEWTRAYGLSPPDRIYQILEELRANGDRPSP